MSDADSKTLPPLPLSRSPRDRTTTRRGIPLSIRVANAQSHNNNVPYHAAITSDGQQTQEPTPLESRRVVSEPEMTPLEGIPGLHPPPAFQERFKYVICSSGLLKERPDFEGKRRARRDSTAHVPHEMQEPRMSLAGLGIQDVSYDHGYEELDTAALQKGGLRRRRIGSGERENEMATPPESFRRLSSSCASASARSTPVLPSSKEYRYRGWRSLAYMPFVRALSPYMEPIVLLLSSLLWIFEIVGWIWLEILAVGAIALCGFANVIVKMSKEEKRSRSRARTRTRRSRSAERIPHSAHATSAVAVQQEMPSAQPEQIDDLSTIKPGTVSAIHQNEQSGGEMSHRADEHDEPAAITLATQLRQPDDTYSGTQEATSLQGIALETLQAVVQNAEGMDEVIGNALTLIGESER